MMYGLFCSYVNKNIHKQTNKDLLSKACNVVTKAVNSHQKHAKF